LLLAQVVTLAHSRVVSQALFSDRWAGQADDDLARAFSKEQAGVQAGNGHAAQLDWRIQLEVGDRGR
jgi:hypothetical protein